jgi:hypothetical protein
MVTFQECVFQCLENPDFVTEFDRLTGCNLAAKEDRSLIEIMVDDATGYEEKSGDLDLQKFIAFVYEVVWIRLSPRARAPQNVKPPPGRSFEELTGDQVPEL